MTEQEYKELSEKMRNDAEFWETIKSCKTEREIYDTYKNAGYTDVDFEEFKSVFPELKRIVDVANQVASKDGKTFVKLTDAQLDQVVGGFDLLKFFVGLTDFIPLVGPLVSGSIKAIKAFASGDIEKGVMAIVDGTWNAGLSTFAAGGLGRGIEGLFYGSLAKTVLHKSVGENTGFENIIDAFQS